MRGIGIRRTLEKFENEYPGSGAVLPHPDPVFVTLGFLSALLAVDHRL